MEPGLPKLEPPPFSTTVQNTTFSFIEMTSTLGSGIVVVPLLALLENISGAKVFCKYVVQIGNCMNFNKKFK